MRLFQLCRSFFTLILLTLSLHLSFFFFFFLMIRRPPRSTLDRSSAASDVYKRQLRDLTERKKSEDAIKTYVKELEELNSHKESVLAILSHDLRSPLSAIIGTAKYLKSNFHKMKTEVISEMLELLHKSTTDELEMLDYLVEWARIKYASEVFSPKKLNLIEYIDKVFFTLKETASLKVINLHHEIPENTTVFADGKMLLSIIQNIISNAIKHTQNGGSIAVSSKIKNNKIIIQIKDNGVGMTKEIQEKLFKPQIKALSEVRKENQGAGIGLLLVKGFLEKNDGEIWVESCIGEGSSFYFTSVSYTHLTLPTSDLV